MKMLHFAPTYTHHTWQTYRHTQNTYIVHLVIYYYCGLAKDTVIQIQQNFVIYARPIKWKQQQ